MKTRTGIIIALGLGLQSLQVSALQPYGDYMAVCEAQLKAHFGEKAKFQLITSRKYAGGMRLKVAAKVDADNSKFASCWVTEPDLQAFRLKHSKEMVAGHESAAEPADP